MPQYSFTSKKELVEVQIQEIADKEGRSRSEMIDILLRLAVKEKTRKRHAKKDNSKCAAANLGKGNSTG